MPSLMSVSATDFWWLVLDSPHGQSCSPPLPCVGFTHLFSQQTCKYVANHQGSQEKQAFGFKELLSEKERERESITKQYPMSGFFGHPFSTPMSKIQIDFCAYRCSHVAEYQHRRHSIHLLGKTTKWVVDTFHGVFPWLPVWHNWAPVLPNKLLFPAFHPPPSDFLSSSVCLPNTDTPLLRP